MHLTTGSLVRLYPRPWRDRYGDEMLAMLEAGPVRARDGLDLVRGALDAWLHPATRSWLPAGAAIVGGGLWTVAAAAVLSQPAPLDWPGYLVDILAITLAAAGILLVATIGCSLRVGDAGGRSIWFAVWLSIIGYLGWMAALTATAAGIADGPTLAVAQTMAMVGATAVGIALIRAGDERIGLLVMAGALAMLIPWTVTWLVFGTAWTAIGIALVTERVKASGDRA
jgi:hypothetical protein